MNIGDDIAFGPYKWVVLDIKEDRALLMTKDIVELRDYHHKTESVTWDNCTLRHYLNGEFLLRFTEEERACIVEKHNRNSGNSWYNTDGGPDTVDQVFILSLEEVAGVYFGDSSHLLNHPGINQRYWFQRKDSNNVNRRATYLDLPWWWWVRTPGKHQRVAIYIHGDGNIGIQGNGVSKRHTNVVHPTVNETKGGLRPALWINTKKEMKK